MPRKPVTYQDLVEVPENKVAEIVGGDLYVCPRPASRHSFASMELGGELTQHFGRRQAGRKGWWFFDEPELHLGDDVLVPDIAGWRCERMPGLPDCAAFHFAPDWLCEILSPSTEKLDRVHKLPAYAAAEVKHVWLINPGSRTLEVLRLDRGQWSLIGTYGRDALVQAEPFETAEIDLLALWGESRQT